MQNLLSMILCCTILAVAPIQGKPPKGGSGWRAELAKKLPVFGHRNWIVIADSAYPAQSGQGIETIYAGGDHLAVIEEVLDMLAKSKHVQPVVYMDKELKSVAEGDAPGIGDYYRVVVKVVKGKTVKVMPHEEIIRKLDKAGKLFHVLVIKTDMALPYTSVFLELEGRYWGPVKEKHLRDSMKRLPGK